MATESIDEGPVSRRSKTSHRPLQKRVAFFRCSAWGRSGRQFSAVVLRANLGDDAVNSAQIMLHYVLVASESLLECRAAVFVDSKSAPQYWDRDRVDATDAQRRLVVPGPRR